MRRHPKNRGSGSKRRQSSKRTRGSRRSQQKDRQRYAGSSKSSGKRTTSTNAGSYVDSFVKAAAHNDLVTIKAVYAKMENEGAQKVAEMMRAIVFRQPLMQAISNVHVDMVGYLLLNRAYHRDTGKQADYMSILERTKKEYEGHPCMLKRIQEIETMLQKALKMQPQTDLSSASQPKSTLSSSTSSGTQLSVSVQDANGKLVIFTLLPRRASVPKMQRGKVIFKYDENDKIFFAPAYHPPQTDTARPTMLIPKGTWDKVVAYRNKLFSPSSSSFDKSENYMEMTHKKQKWFVVWKFPTFLEYIPIYSSTKTWLPVTGTYMMMVEDDKRSQPISSSSGVVALPVEAIERATYFMTFKPKLFGEQMMQYQYDTPNFEVKIHMLQHNSSHKIPMISLTYFFSSTMNAPLAHETRKVIQLIDTLNKLGVAAFLCLKHKALVFYGYDQSRAKVGDTTTTHTLTTRSFADIMTRIVSIKTALKGACCNRGLQADMDIWWANVQQIYQQN